MQLLRCDSDVNKQCIAVHFYYCYYCCCVSWIFVQQFGLTHLTGRVMDSWSWFKSWEVLLQTILLSVPQK